MQEIHFPEYRSFFEYFNTGISGIKVYGCRPLLEKYLKDVFLRKEVAPVLIIFIDLIHNTLCLLLADGSWRWKFSKSHLTDSDAVVRIPVVQVVQCDPGKPVNNGHTKEYIPQVSVYDAVPLPELHSNPDKLVSGYFKTDSFDPVV
jgi:hypothetical protein